MRVLGPFIVLAGALITLPSMLGMSEAVQLSIGRWWTLIIAVAALVMAALLRATPIVRWRRRTLIALSVTLILYGIVLGLWGVFVANQHHVPAGDLPYLLGLPLMSGVGGTVTLATVIGLGRRGQPAES
jgi:uncharacterized membrane protein YczE